MKRNLKLREWVFMLIVLNANVVLAQDQEPESSSPGHPRALSKSYWSMSSRSFFMSTMNKGEAKDDFACAQGIGFSIQTLPIKGWQVQASSYFIFNLASSNLAERDDKSNGLNRYEIGQFDITNRGSKKYLNRLEELQVTYSRALTQFRLGRMILETPFVNMQDGRMRPTIEEGAWLRQETESKKLKLQGGVLWRISPRSTIDWFGLTESIGLYGSGTQVNGKSASYAFDSNSNRLWMINPEVNLSPKVRLSYWNVWLERVMNTSMIELNLKEKLNNKNLYFNAMWIYQSALGGVAHTPVDQSYIQKGARSNVFSSQIGILNHKWNLNLNYTRIFDQDRYLMPREWGRDPFYTFMPRERNEGLANVNACTFQASRRFDSGWKMSGAIGYFRLPSVTNFEQNKYGMPSYGQANVKLTYPFRGNWKNAEFRFLLAAKKEFSNEVLQPKYVYNKVEMVNANLILDYRF